MSTTELARAAAVLATVVVVPIGAVEQHGGHLPVDVDIHIVTEIVKRAAVRDAQTIVGPGLAFGLSGSHAAFAGTVAFRSETMLAVVKEILCSVLRSGFKRILILNGHNGNSGIIGQAVTDVGLTTDAANIFAASYIDLIADVYTAHRLTMLGGSGHACEFETSIELALRPELVADTRERQYVQPTVTGTFADITRRGYVARSNDLARNYVTGVMGDPSVATRELGEVLLEAAVNGTVSLVEEIRSLGIAGSGDGAGFPAPVMEGRS